MSTSRTREKADGELFKSTGIDDNATSTAVTIDASENVGVGTSSPLGNLSVEGNGRLVTIGDSGSTNVPEIKATNAAGTGEAFLKISAYEHRIGTNSTQRLTVQNNGHVKINTGNLIIGTSGKGIDFSANADSSATGASTTSELLDSYEEGTFTPVYTGSSTSGQTYSAQEGSYTKIGRVVHIQAWVKVTNKGTMSGPIRISGFPFTVSPTNQSAISIGYTNGYNLTAGNNLQLWAYSDSFVYLFQAGGTNNSAHITTGDLDTEVWTAIGGTYHTNA